jgi:hypothetical protein
MEKPDGAAPPEASLVEDVNTRPDDALRLLVHVVNDSGEFELGVPVTLQVSGTIVSGILIPHKAYWEAFRALLQGAGSPSREIGEAFTAPFFEGIEAAKQAEEDGVALPPPNYIHLRDAVVWTPGVDQPLPKTLWRGRLSHVSAWSIGIYGK